MPFANDCIERAGICLNKIQTVQVSQCVHEHVTIQLRNRDGTPMDISSYLFPTGSSLSSISSENSSSSSNNAKQDVWGCDDPTKNGVEVVAKEFFNSAVFFFRTPAYSATVEEAQKGIIHIAVTPNETNKPGVWLGQVIVWDHGRQVKHMPLYWYVSPSLGSFYRSDVAITLSEIRLFMRDNCPDDNFLLDTVELKDEEIMACIRAPIDYWNAEPPDLGMYSPVNFPFREQHKNAVIGELLRIMSLWLRRNDLDYTAAGLTVADTKKWPDYARMSQERLSEWKDFTKRKKVSLNAEAAFGTLDGFYRGVWGH